VAERASQLNVYQMAVGDPGYAEKDLARYRAATPAKVQAAVKAALDPNARVILRIVPKEAPPEGDAKKAPAAKKGGK
jgi:predicted Zn-dependent peptidase